MTTRHREDRAEQILEQVDVQRARCGDEHHAERDPRIEDESERLVARGPSPRAQELDGDAAQDRSDERCEDR